MDNIRNLRAVDMTDAMHSAIRSMIGQGRPDNVVAHNSASDSDWIIAGDLHGPRPTTRNRRTTRTSKGNERFSGNDLVCRAVNSASIVDL